jgi:hypothetical protein
MIDVPERSYESWVAELASRARDLDLAWLVSEGPSAHRAAFDAGLSPEEELIALKDMSEWRGCGCGGS